MLGAEGRAKDDRVVALGIELAVGFVGEAGAAIGEPGLQDDVAGIENLVIGFGFHCASMDLMPPMPRSPTGRLAADDRRRR
jgi:hypothetical protein